MHDFSFDEARQVAEVVVHAHVHHGQACSGIARKGIDGPPSLKEVARLDVRYVRGGQAEAVVGNVVVGGEENHRLVFQARSGVAGHGGYLDGYRFQLSQRKRRLGQNFLMLQGGLGGLFVQRGYVQFVHDGCK